MVQPNRMTTLWTFTPMLSLALLLAWSPYGFVALFNMDDCSPPDIVKNCGRNREIISGSHLPNYFFPTALVIGFLVAVLVIIGKIFALQKNGLKLCRPSNLFMVYFFLLMSFSTAKSSSSSCNASNPCRLVCLNMKEMDTKQCTVLDFDLVIGNMTRINASTLANIREITGELRIERTRSEFIRFPNLTTIGSLTVTGNRLMKSIQLPKLKYFSSAKMEKVYIKNNGFAWNTKEVNNFLNKTDLYICNVRFDAFNIARPLNARLLGLIWFMPLDGFIILVTIAAGCYYCPRCIFAKIKERGTKSMFRCLRFLVLKDVYEKKVEQLEKEERKLRSKMSPGDKERHWQKSKAYNGMPYFGSLIPKQD